MIPIFFSSNFDYFSWNWKTWNIYCKVNKFVTIINITFNFICHRVISLAVPGWDIFYFLRLNINLTTISISPQYQPHHNINLTTISTSPQYQPHHNINLTTISTPPQYQPHHDINLTTISTSPANHWLIIVKSSVRIMTNIDYPFLKPCTYVSSAHPLINK